MVWNMEIVGTVQALISPKVGTGRITIKADIAGITTAEPSILMNCAFFSWR